MSISRKITGDASGGSGGSSKYVDDVFSTYLYTGTGADRDIVNGIEIGPVPDYTVNSANFDVPAGYNAKVSGFNSNDFALSSNFCISFWIKVNTRPITSMIFDTRNSVSAAYGVLYFENANLRLNAGLTSIISAGSLYDDFPSQWVHVVFARVGSTLSVFRNGVRYGTATYSATIPSQNNAFANSDLAVLPLNNAELSDFKIVTNTAAENVPYDPTSSTCPVPTKPERVTPGTTILAFSASEDSATFWTNKANGAVLSGAPVSSGFEQAESPYAQLPEPSEGKGGLVWLKNRSAAEPHYLFDTERGENRRLYSNGANSEVLGSNTLNSFNDDGFSLGAGDVTKTGDWVSWSFAKQEGFFDIVTWTGDNVVGRTVPHNLGSTPGMVIIKCVSHSSSWLVWHKDLLNYEYYLALDTTASQVNTNKGFTALPTDSELNLTAFVGVNSLNREYVAYVFADDAPMFGPNGDESIIKCGSYTGNGSDNGPEIDLGWEPQWLLIKNTSSSEYWVMIDTMRGATAARGYDSVLYPNENDGEAEWRAVWPKATGFQINDSGSKWNTSNDNYIYMAIRRPNKPAEEFEPEELFAVEEATGSVLPQFKSGFPVDFAFRRSINGALDTDTSARLIQGTGLKTNTNAAAETNAGSAYFDFQNGWRDSGADSSTLLSWMWRRAPGFFDVTTVRGTGAEPLVVPHNLGAKPEMLWYKGTSWTNGSSWYVVCTAAPNGDTLGNLDNALSFGGNSLFPVDLFTEESFTISFNGYAWNQYPEDYIAMMWASVPGICDIGTYTGTGDWQYIDCGFDTAIPRFVLIKAVSEAGNWYYWDTLRGITSGNDPYLQLNSTAAQVTNENWISPSPQGQIGGFFIESSSSSQIYKDGVEYIYMAIA